MKYYIIAGEASGDLHAANLIKELNKKDLQANFRGFGGDKMQAAGLDLLVHYKQTAFMGFLEVLKNIRTILGFLKQCKADVLQYQPDVLILVDYPGFNLKMADFAKKQGIKVFYYISPQVWAWKSSRVNKIREAVDRMFVILPFEKDFYQKWNYEVDFVGHPLLDAIDQRTPQSNFKLENKLDERPIIALLPGSRKQEIQVMLPSMLQVQQDFRDYQFVVAGVDSQDKEFYQSLIGEANLVIDQTYDLLENATAALVTSGTATLETALFQVPQVVCYKGSWVSYWIARNFIKVKYISLVNLVMDRIVVKELIQHDLNRTQLRQELKKVLQTPHQKKIEKEYQELAIKLGGTGASQQTAKLMYQYLVDA